MKQWEETYDEPTFTETTAITRTSYTISPKTVEKEQEKKPEVAPHRTGSPVDEKLKSKNKDDSFLRTQSEFIDRSSAVPPHILLRSDEKPQIYDMPAEKLKRYTFIQ
ncbi:hypothetical protein COOONC_11425 [Cooperia oncophora]